MSTTLNSNTRICNLALAKLGEPALSALDNTSQSGRLCLAFYEHVRDRTLEGAFWTFAMKRVDLALDGTAPDSTYSYRHVLPSDYLKIRFFNRESPEELDESYQIESGFLLSDSATAFILYTRRVTSEAEFSPLFVEAFACELAAELCLPLSGSVTTKEALVRSAMAAYSKAATEDANTNKTRIRGLNHMLFNSALVKARRGWDAG